MFFWGWGQTYNTFLDFPAFSSSCKVPINEIISVLHGKWGHCIQKSMLFEQDSIQKWFPVRKRLDVSRYGSTACWVFHLRSANSNQIVFKTKHFYPVLYTVLCSCSIGHILEHEICHLGCWAEKENFWNDGISAKVSNFLGWFFQLFEGKKKFKIFLKTF